MAQLQSPQVKHTLRTKHNGHRLHALLLNYIRTYIQIHYTIHAVVQNARYTIHTTVQYCAYVTTHRVVVNNNYCSSRAKNYRGDVGTFNNFTVYYLHTNERTVVKISTYTANIFLPLFRSRRRDLSADIFIRANVYLSPSFMYLDGRRSEPSEQLSRTNITLASRSDPSELLFSVFSFYSSKRLFRVFT